MASYSMVTVVGNVTRDIELRHTASVTAVCSVSIAINHKYYNKTTQTYDEEVCYIDCDCFGKTADNAAKYLSKGALVLFSGRLAQDNWQDKQSGQNRSKHKISVSSMTMLGGGVSPQSTAGEENQDTYRGDLGDDVPF